MVNTVKATQAHFKVNKWNDPNIPLVFEMKSKQQKEPQTSSKSAGSPKNLAIYKDFRFHSLESIQVLKIKQV